MALYNVVRSISHCVMTDAKIIECDTCSVMLTCSVYIPNPIASLRTVTHGG